MAVCIRSYTRFPLLILLYVCAGGKTHAQQTDRIDTDFQPSRDLPAVQNRKGSDFASNGQCNGIDEMAQAYYRWRKQNPNSPSLAAVSGELMTKQGYSYLEKTLDLVTAKSVAKGYSRSEPSFAYRNPSGFERKLVQKLQESREPQSISLAPDPSAPDPFPHRVTVYGAQKIVTPEGERWEFKVGDSNQFGKGDPDQVRLVYVPGPRNTPGHWSERRDGKEIEKWLGGDVIHGPIDQPSDYITILQRAQKGDRIGDIRKDLKIPEHRLDTVRMPVSAVKDPKVGGVMVRFDPALFLESVPEAELKQIEEKYRAFLSADASEAAIFRLHADRLDLRLVPLKSLLVPGAQTIGDLTRVRGYVRSASGEIFLVGLAEAGKTAIPIDELVVALRAVYRATLTPFISLDPDPHNLIGPQKVRIGAIPADLRGTTFVRTMIEADYLMKRIALGKVKPKAQGFQRWIDILAAGDYRRTSKNRMWLSPLAAPVADVLVTHRDTEEAVLFESHAQVQAEEMFSGGDRLLGMGGATEDTDLAAAQYTDHFEALAQEFPEFAGLEQIFDLCKIATAWRVFGVKSADIEALADRKPATVAIAPTYPGIGPDAVPGKTTQIYGGATTECPLVRRAAVTTDCLLPLLDAAGKANSAQVTLPEEMDLGVGRAVALRINADIEAARASLNVGDCSEVIDRTSAVLEVAPDYDEAHLLRADAYTLLNRLPEACADYDALAAIYPEACARRAILRARMDDREGARKDIAEAQRRAPDSDPVRAMTILAYLELIDLPNATRALDTFALVAPTHPLIPSLKAHLSDLETRTPEEARRYLRLEATIPPRIAMVFAQAQPDSDYADLDIPHMLDVLTQIEGGEIAVKQEMEIPYRARICLLYGYGALGRRFPDQAEAARTAGDAVYRRLLALYPNRALPHIVRAQMAVRLGESPQTVADYLRKAAALPLKDDPIYPHLRWIVGSDRVFEALTLEIWGGISRPEARANELLDLVLAHSSAPEAALVRALEDDTERDLPGYLRDWEAHFNDPDVAPKRKRLAELARLTHLLPANLSADSPFVPLVSRLYLHVSLLKLQLMDSEGFQENTFRGVAALQHAHPAIHRDDSPGKSLGILLMIYSVFEFGQAVRSQAEREKQVDAIGRTLKKLEGPPAAPVARFREESVKEAALLSATYQAIGAHYRESLNRLQSASGPLAGALCEMLPALFQEAFRKEDFAPDPGLIQAYPTLAQSPELLKSRSALLTTLTHTFTRRSSDALYRQTLDRCRNGTDFEAVAAFIEAIRQMNKLAPLFRTSPETDQKLIRWIQEARFHTD
ncbi:MAG: signal peptide protein [Chthonomonadaceae bacterium]|nr:signal peptide protein [Chthonomonadaceae bacterium]